jgi:hypothetical protein
MKLLTVCFVCAILFHQQVRSQDSLKPKEIVLDHKIFKATLYFNTGESTRAPFMAIMDSSAFLFVKKKAVDPFHKEKNNIPSTWDKYHYKIIESIKIDNQKARTWSVLTGLVVGIAVGAIIGYNAGSDQGTVATAEMKAVLVGILGGGLGAIAGFAVSSAFDKKYLINGEWKSLEELKATLKY